MTELYGDVTAFTRAPAEGEDKSADGKVQTRFIVEVMTDAIDRRWWKQSRERLEDLFQQDEIVEHGLVRVRSPRLE